MTIDDGIVKMQAFALEHMDSFAPNKEFYEDEIDYTSHVAGRLFQFFQFLDSYRKQLDMEYEHKSLETFFNHNLELVMKNMALEFNNRFKRTIE